MAFISSTKVKVFPTAYRGNNGDGVKFNPEANLTTENTLTSIVRRVTSNGSYVLTDTYVENSDFEFNIHGYYFKLVGFKLTDVSGYGNKLFAKIRISALGGGGSDQGNISYEGLTLVGAEGQTPLDQQDTKATDSPYVFTGLELIKTNDDSVIKQSETGAYELLLLENASIPLKSKMRNMDYAIGVLDTDNTTNSLQDVLRGTRTFWGQTMNLRDTSSTISGDLTNVGNIFASKSGNTIGSNSVRFDGYFGTLNTTYCTVGSDGLSVSGNTDLCATSVTTLSTSGNITLGPNCKINGVTISGGVITGGSFDTSGNISCVSLTVGGASSLDTVNAKSIEASEYIKASSFYATSDRNLKENIELYKPEKSILDLNVYKYDFIDGAKNQIGCIAQELREICPEIVNENENGYLTIQENKLVYLLLDEVKKLKEEIKYLKGE